MFVLLPSIKAARGGLHVGVGHPCGQPSDAVPWDVRWGASPSRCGAGCGGWREAADTGLAVRGTQVTTRPVSPSGKQPGWGRGEVTIE